MLIKYGAGKMGKRRTETLDKMTRKVLAMNGAFHSKRDVDMLYGSREDGGRADK